MVKGLDAVSNASSITGTANSKRDTSDLHTEME